MRVMGIDPGLTRCGLGVVDVDASRRASLVYVGVARTDKDLATHFRLRTIADAIDSVIERYEPEVVAIERVFAQDNLQSVTTTMQVMGAAMTCVGRAGLPMAVHTPSEVIRLRCRRWLRASSASPRLPSPRMPRTLWPLRLRTRGGGRVCSVLRRTRRSQCRSRVA